MKKWMIIICAIFPGGGYIPSYFAEKNARIKELKLACGTFDQSIYEEPFFQYSNVYRDAWLGYKKLQDMYRKSIINYINLTLDENDVVAIRGGGEHTIKLMEVLKGECTVRYVFDKNSNDKKQGAITMINSCEMKNYHDVTAVLISSFHYRTEMKQELADFSSEVKIIDIYDCLEKEYGEFEKPFYQVVPE